MSNDRVRVRGVTIHRPIIYGNTATVLSPEEKASLHYPDHTHRWTVAVRSAASASDSDIVGGADDLSHFVKRVTFKLHETYPSPTRNLDKPPFEVTETGWGEFEIQIRITFINDSGEKAVSFYHHLKLHPWNLTTENEVPPIEQAIAHGPVHSWQYDEIVFNDPFQSFLTILTNHPPTPLPKAKRRPVPFHTSNPGSLEDSKGGLPEFNASMEKEEADRLDTAKKAIVEQTEKMRALLIEREAELIQLQTEINGS